MRNGAGVAVLLSRGLAWGSALFLLAFGTATAAPTPFVCSNNFYIVQGSAASVTLNTLNIGAKTLTPIGSATSTLYNGIGFRPQDGFIWGSDGNVANKIVQVDATGTLNVLPLTGGITLSNSGDVNPVTGLYYNGGGGTTTLNEINVAAVPNPALVRTLTLSQKIGFDMAFSPLSGKAYTVYQGQLYSFAIPASGTAVTVNGPLLTTGVTLPAGDTYGAAFFDQNGIFYPYDNKGTLYRVNLNTSPATVSIAASGLPNVANNDGAWCAAAPNMTKDANPRALVPGGTTTYTFAINNILAATNVTFTDTLPAGLTFVPGTVSPTTVAGGTPVLSGGNATLTIPNMTLAGTTSYTFTIQAQAAISANGDYPNQANLTGTIYGGNAQVSAVSSDPTLLAPYQPTVVGVAVPRLGLTKTSNGPWTVGQAGATFTLSVTNSGTAATTGTITVLDTLPAGISAVSGTYSGWACTVAGQSVTCTSTTSIAATNGTSSITLPVTVAAAAAGSVTNNASVGGGGDPNNGGSPPSPGSCVGGDPHCASTTTTVNLPQLTVTKSASPVAFTVGGTGTYSLTVGNAGTASTAGNITITDALPSGVTTTATPSGAGWNCSASTPTNVSCTTAAVLAVGGSAPVISVPVAIAVGTASPAVNTAAVTGGGDTTCPGSAHCFAQISTTVNAPSLGIAKTANGPWTAGQSGAQYTLTVTNTGTAATTGTITVLDTMPTGVTPSLASPFTSGSWTCNFASPTLTCTSAASIAATSGTSTISVPVNVTAAAIPNVTNQASVGGGGDPNNGGAPPAPGSCAGGDPHCGSTMTTVSAPSAPTITKAFGAASIPLNGTTSLSFTVTNPNAATTLTGVGVTDTLPVGLVVSTPNGLTGSCGGGTITATAGSGSVSLSGATLAANASCTFSVNVTGVVAGDQNNTTGNVTSTEGGNGGTASANVTIVAPPSIAKAFSPTTIAINGTTQLTLTITNPNAGTALNGVAVTDTFPANLLVATPNALSNTCGGTATAVAGTGSVSLSGGTIAAGGSCTIVLNVTATANGSYTNTTGNVLSTNGGTGNTGSATLTVATPKLSVVKSGPASATVGVAYNYTITVTNTGTAATTAAATVTDTVPAGLTINSVTPGSPTCTIASQVVTCTIASGMGTGAGNAVTYTINVTPTASATSPVTNTADVGGGGDPGCPVATPCVSPPVTTTLNAALLQILKTGPATAAAGGNIAYTITVTNIGSAAATNAILADPAPGGLTYVSSGAPCASGFPCDLGMIAVGQTITIPTVTFAIGANVTGSIVNIASVTSDQTTQTSSSASTVVRSAVKPIKVPALDWRGMLLLALMVAVGGSYWQRQRDPMRR